MTFFLISDNHDSLVGMRLAGIEGVVVHQKQHVEAALNKALEDENIGIILITEKLVPLVSEKIDDIKLNRSKPLVLSIPDRHGFQNNDSIAGYIRDAIGVKL